MICCPYPSMCVQLPYWDPGADNLQPGDYTPKLRPGQLKSVLTGIKQAVGNQTKILYEQGCEFTGSNGENIPNAVKVAAQSDVVVLVLGDCSTSEATTDVYKTSGENHDYATLILPGRQQELLGSCLCNRKACCFTASNRSPL